MVNREALTGCTGREHKSNKKKLESDDVGGPGRRMFCQTSKVNSLRGTNRIVNARFIYVAVRCIYTLPVSLLLMNTEESPCFTVGPSHSQVTHTLHRKLLTYLLHGAESFLRS